ncbi:hypothetical protein STENM36S_08370 [Streptomyces tendae]
MSVEAGYFCWSRPIVFSGVPWWVCTWTWPSRLTTESAKFTLFTRYLARARAAQYSREPTRTTFTPLGTRSAFSARTAHTRRMCGASRASSASIAAGLQETLRFQ